MFSLHNYSAVLRCLKQQLWEIIMPLADDYNTKILPPSTWDVQCILLKCGVEYHVVCMQKRDVCCMDFAHECLWVNPIYPSLQYSPRYVIDPHIMGWYPEDFKDRYWMWHDLYMIAMPQDYKLVVQCRCTTCHCSSDAMGSAAQHLQKKWISPCNWTYDCLKETDFWASEPAQNGSKWLTIFHTIAGIEAEFQAQPVPEKYCIGVAVVAFHCIEPLMRLQWGSAFLWWALPFTCFASHPFMSFVALPSALALTRSGRIHLEIDLTEIETEVGLDPLLGGSCPFLWYNPLPFIIHYIPCTHCKVIWAHALHRCTYTQKYNSFSIAVPLGWCTFHFRWHISIHIFS